MILLDVNTVMALFVERHPHHRAARNWYEQTRVDREEYGAPPTVWHSFVRLATNRSATGAVISLQEAFAFMADMRSAAGYRDIHPGKGHLRLFRQTCEQASARGNLVPDAALAAIAIENGATLASFDRDFARFPGLRWIVPGE
ncbi:MAG: PIN domain-containing protein [Jatrophihabitans sp.]|nr:MAG: PIN domain-containing protein [Jatrophihabitans sp.]